MKEGTISLKMIIKERLMTTLDEQVLHAINTNNSFVIVSHIRPDGDAIGSALGLAHSLRLAGKTAEVVLEDGVAENT